MDSSSPSLCESTTFAYRELRQIAEFILRTKPSWTLSPTGLVHEAFIKLAGSKRPNWQDQRHFVSACAQAMRHLMIDLARKKLALVHGGNMKRHPLDDSLLGRIDCDRFVKLNEALEALQSLDQRQAEIVHLRFFVGLTNQEVAELVGVTRRTVQTEWRMAKAWLYRELNDEPHTSAT